MGSDVSGPASSGVRWEVEAARGRHLERSARLQTPPDSGRLLCPPPSACRAETSQQHQHTAAACEMNNKYMLAALCCVQCLRPKTREVYRYELCLSGSLHMHRNTMLLYPTDPAAVCSNETKTTAVTCK